MRESNNDIREVDYGALHELQDAWADIADFTTGLPAEETNAIEATVLAAFPDFPYVTWDQAEVQAARLVISSGQRERLRKSGYVPLDAADAAAGEQKNKSASIPPPPAPSLLAGAADMPAETLPAAEAPIQYVTREQIGVMVGRGKDTIERWLNRDSNAPEPINDAGGGKAYEYDWASVRPWLATKTNRWLPDRYPGLP